MNMKMRALLIGSASVATLAAAISVSRAQWRLYPGGGYYKAATAEESFARGISDMVRAAGENNVMNSVAARHYEEARSRNLDNRLKATKTFFERRRFNKEYREAERGPRPTAEQLFRLAKDQVPAKLSPSELDPLTGEINWPSLLRSEPYEASRKQLESAFAEHVRQQGGNSKDIRDAGQQMQAELKNRISDYAPDEYMNAKNFIDSLLYATRSVAG